jgi:hypothetical protein
MSNISVIDLKIAGSEIFCDLESYPSELDELEEIFSIGAGSRYCDPSFFYSEPIAETWQLAFI